MAGYDWLVWFSLGGRLCWWDTLALQDQGHEKEHYTPSQDSFSDGGSIPMEPGIRW